MTYLVLARKWRPRSFDTLVGQDHVVRALTHALSTQRLHHAWLFTGTRGVGKTTLSRILAKSLNCVNGITPTPCGVCQACTEIDSGRFVDYIELDAASNRGVDEMTQLLDQAVYSPSSGRFKVYMIDEVHMLSGHAFNAMLKTLEEPPPHVKFILATTDPQKIPMTVLSRCLQFNLKQMAAGSIVSYLENVLAQEEISFEVPALRLLAKAASGSMRDALSLTDQAIAYSAGNITAESMLGMLGAIDQSHLLQLLQAMAAGNADKVLVVANQLAERGLSYSGALGDLAVLLSRIAIEQRVPGSVATDDPQANDIVSLAQELHPDQIQLFYSVAVHSRQELSLAPDEYAGFVMACLRMLSLAPSSSVPPRPIGTHTELPAPATPTVVTQPSSLAAPTNAANSAPSVVSSPLAVVSSIPQAPTTQEFVASKVAMPAAEVASEVHAAANSTELVPDASLKVITDIPVETARPESPVAVTSSAPAMADDIPAWDDVPFETDVPDDVIQDPEFNSQQIDDLPAPVFAMGKKKTKSPKLSRMTPQTWPGLVATLPLTGLASGLAAELARQSEWLDVQDNIIRLRVAVHTLAEGPGKTRLQTLLSEHFGAVIQLQVEYGATGDATAHAVAQARKEELQQQAQENAHADPFVQALVADFGARIVPGSISAVAA